MVPCWRVDKDCTVAYIWSSLQSTEPTSLYMQSRWRAASDQGCRSDQMMGGNDGEDRRDPSEVIPEVARAETQLQPVPARGQAGPLLCGARRSCSAHLLARRSLGLRGPDHRGSGSARLPRRPSQIRRSPERVLSVHGASHRLYDGCPPVHPRASCRLRGPAFYSGCRFASGMLAR